MTQYTIFLSLIALLVVSCGPDDILDNESSDSDLQPVNGEDGAISSSLQSSRVKAPTITKNGERISWSAVSAADGYNVYLNGKYLTTISATSYVALASGTYEVTSFDRDTTPTRYSVSSNAVQVTLSTTPTSPTGSHLKAPAITKNGERISWSAVSAADGYNVYLNGKYLTTISATSYVALASGTYEVTSFDRDTTPTRYSVSSNAVQVTLSTTKQAPMSALPPLWSNQGYTLFWEHTPTAQDMGTDPERYFKDKWNNGHTFLRYRASNADTISMDYAPDGSPSVKGFLKNGTSKDGGVFGNQMGPTGVERQVVWSMQWYNPCQGGFLKNDISGGYFGFGHHWGSEDGVTTWPGGSTRREDSWSFRVILTRSGLYALYAYIPDRPNDSGQTFVSTMRPGCDAWTTIDMEIIQNSPASASNGIARLYVNGALAVERTGIRTRRRAGIRPKGVGIFLQHNGNPIQDESYYWRNWRLYVK